MSRPMFKARTPKIKEFTDQEGLKPTIEKLEDLFVSKTNIYIDFANVRPWSNKLGWHINPKRLYQFLTSFDNVGQIKFYQGELIGDVASKSEIKTLTECKYI